MARAGHVPEHFLRNLFVSAATSAGFGLEDLDELPDGML